MAIGGSRGWVGRLCEGDEAILHVIERIVAPLGLRVDATSPWVDARLPDGSRVQTRILSTHIISNFSGPQAGRLLPRRSTQQRDPKGLGLRRSSGLAARHGPDTTGTGRFACACGSVGKDGFELSIDITTG